MSVEPRDLLTMRRRLLRALGLGSAVVTLAAGCAPADDAMQGPGPTEPASAPVVDLKADAPATGTAAPAVERELVPFELPLQLAEHYGIGADGLRGFAVSVVREVPADHVQTVHLVRAMADVTFEVEVFAPRDGALASVAFVEGSTNLSGDGTVRFYAPDDVDAAAGAIELTVTFPGGERVTNHIPVTFTAAPTNHPTAPLLHPGFTDDDLIMGKAYRACAPMPEAGCGDPTTFDDWEGRELASFALDRPLDPDAMALGCTLDFERETFSGADEECCYVVSIGFGATTPMPTCDQQVADDGNGGSWYWYEGRPFQTDEGLREAPVVPVAFGASALELSPPADPALRARVVDAWVATARAEHASIASFSRFQLELLALGAPADLLQRAAQAIADELAHAELAFAVASQLGDAPVGPGPLAIDGALTRSIDAAAVLTGAIVEGCVNETIASLAVRRAASATTDPALARELERVADDEAKHAELSWAFVRWLLSARPELVEVARVAFAEATAPRARAEALDDDPRLAAWGVLSDAEQQAIAIEGIDRVVRPCAEALLATC